MKYKLLAHQNRETLQSEINKMLSNGWVLHGSTQASVLRNGVSYSQALTLEEKEVE